MSNRLVSIPPAIWLFMTHPITRHQLFRTFLRVARWQITSRRDRDSQVPWIAGTHLVARRGMAGATGNIYCGLHEYSDMGFVMHFLRQKDLFIDVGANIGSYTVLASGAIGARSVSIEPNHATANAIRRNIEVNGIEELVNVVEAAAGADLGTVTMTSHLDTMNYITSGKSLATCEVPLITLDSLNLQPVAIKLDLDGYEFRALQGATKTLQSPSLKALIVEFDDDRAIRILNECGFSRYAYDPVLRQISENLETHFGYNSLYLRDLDFVKRRVATAEKINIFGKRI